MCQAEKYFVFFHTPYYFNCFHFVWNNIFFCKFAAVIFLVEKPAKLNIKFKELNFNIAKLNKNRF